MKKLLALFICFLFLSVPFTAFVSAETVLLGDVNKNGKIDAADYAMVKRHYLRTYEMSEEQKTIADCNGNKSIDAADYAMIKRHYLKTYVLKGTVEVGQSGNAGIKIGLLCLHDEISAFDNAFITGLENACKANGVEYVIRRYVAENDMSIQAADELLRDGCNVVFGNSFGHDYYLPQAAKEHPDAHFFTAAGVTAGYNKLPNYHNIFYSAYEGRFLNGVAAGLKLNEMINAGKIAADETVVGFVGSFTYAEVKSSYTAFYLGAKAVCPNVTMKVKFVGSWFDLDRESSAAKDLINEGCVILSQFSESSAVADVCEKAKLPYVVFGYNEERPGCVASLVPDWSVGFSYIINALTEGEEIPYDVTGTLRDGAMKYALGGGAAEGTEKTVAEYAERLKKGELFVFDTDTFTVEGKKLNTYMADVIEDGNFEADTQVIKDGHFAESEFRSAPYFDLRIDGITLLNEYY